jgi:hypothetical protein
VIDTLVQGYQALDIPTYVIFGNDVGRPQDLDANRVMCRLLGTTETDEPAPQITANHPVLGRDWETQMKAGLEAIEVGLYDRLVADARQCLGIGAGKNKSLIARYVAEQSVAGGHRAGIGRGDRRIPQATAWRGVAARYGSCRTGRRVALDHR